MRLDPVNVGPRNVVRTLKQPESGTTGNLFLSQDIAFELSADAADDRLRDTMYKEIGNRMKAAMDNRYEVESSLDLYPASDSDDYAHTNNLAPFTLEVGRSFQPDPVTLLPMRQKVGQANPVFGHEIIGSSKEGNTLLRNHFLPS